jgi:uncharacterized protein (TIGR03083 family)
MRNAHEIAAAILGAWALDACSPEEAEMVMDHLPRCDSCATEAVRLRGTADLLGAAARPPAWLRARTLTRAKARRPAASPCPAYAEPYAAQVSVLDSLLGELTEPEWSVNVIYDWSVRDVVAHLAATDSMVAAGLGVDISRGDGADGAGDPPPVANVLIPEVVERRTAVVIDRERRRAPGSTRAAWRRQADALCRALPIEPARRVPGIRIRISDLVVARAFETWVHSDDIAGSLRRRLPPPLPHHLHPIAALGVRSLPRGLALMRADLPGATARVVLEGPGGGEWMLGIGGRDVPAPAPSPDPAAGARPEPDVGLRMDVLEFCFLAGGRRDPAAVEAEITGDENLGRELLMAAPAFSGP